MAVELAHPLFLTVDRFAGGRHSGYVVSGEPLRTPQVRRAFVAITVLLVVEALIGTTAVVVALVLSSRGQHLAEAVWLRSPVVLAMTLTLFYFSLRARQGYYWAYSRLRLFSKIFPVVALVIAAIPGLYPLWMVTEQILFSLVLIGISDYLSSDQMRAAFPRPVQTRRVPIKTPAEPSAASESEQIKPIPDP